jgi:hypothetical protein
MTRKWKEEAWTPTLPPLPGLERAEVAVAYAKLSLSLLDHPLLSRNHVLAMLEKPAFEPHVTKLADLFKERFHPAIPISDAAFENRLDEIDKGAAVRRVGACLGRRGRWGQLDGRLGEIVSGGGGWELRSSLKAGWVRLPGRGR